MSYAHNLSVKKGTQPHNEVAWLRCNVILSLQKSSTFQICYSFIPPIYHLYLHYRTSLISLFNHFSNSNFVTGDDAEETQAQNQTQKYRTYRQSPISFSYAQCWRRIWAFSNGPSWTWWHRRYHSRIPTQCQFGRYLWLTDTRNCSLILILLHFKR